VLRWGVDTTAFVAPRKYLITFFTEYAYTLSMITAILYRAI